MTLPAVSMFNTTYDITLSRYEIEVLLTADSNAIDHGEEKFSAFGDREFSEKSDDPISGDIGRHNKFFGRRYDVFLE